MCKGAAMPRLRGTRLDAGAGSHGDDSFGLAAASTWIPYVDPRSRPPALTYYPPPSITPLAPTSFSLPPSRFQTNPQPSPLSRPLCPPFHPPRRLRLLLRFFALCVSLSLSLSYLFVDSFFPTRIQKFARLVSGLVLLLHEFLDRDLEEGIWTKILRFKVLRDSIMDGWKQDDARGRVFCFW